MTHSPHSHSTMEKLLEQRREAYIFIQGADWAKHVTGWDWRAPEDLISARSDLFPTFFAYLGLPLVNPIFTETSFFYLFRCPKPSSCLVCLQSTLNCGAAWVHLEWPTVIWNVCYRLSKQGYLCSVPCSVKWGCNIWFPLSSPHKHHCRLLMFFFGGGEGMEWKFVKHTEFLHRDLVIYLFVYIILCSLYHSWVTWVLITCALLFCLP